MKPISLEEIRSLPVEEQIKFVGEIRDSIPVANELQTIRESMTRKEIKSIP